jgi:hypothetical protein
MRAGEPVDGIFESLIGPLVEKAVPDWRITLDALLSLPEVGGPVGYSGWMALGVRLAAVEPRIAAAGFFAGGYVPRAQREESRQVTIPLLMLLQWDDEGNPRQRALDLFDAFGSEEKTLHARPDAARAQSGVVRRSTDWATSHRPPRKRHPIRARRGLTPSPRSKTALHR